MSFNFTFWYKNVSLYRKDFSVLIMEHVLSSKRLSRRLNLINGKTLLFKQNL
jgi:hypothetical protein